MTCNCTRKFTFAILIALMLFVLSAGDVLQAQVPDASTSVTEVGKASEGDRQVTLEELKATGLERSRFKNFDQDSANAIQTTVAPQADLDTFEQKIKPLLAQYCFDCHGSEDSEGNIRIDTLDPNLLTGGDTDWWLEVFAVVTKEEMPPSDYDELNSSDRRSIVDWLSSELQTASTYRRRNGTHSSFRRLTRYEYNYALQDLLGLPWDFAKDLPPDPRSEAGFENSSELLHLSVSQFETYHRLARRALERATYSGERPTPLYWNIAVSDLAARQWREQDQAIEETKKKLAEDEEKLTAELERLHQQFHAPQTRTHYKVLSTGRTAPAKWSYPGARYANAPGQVVSAFPELQDCVAVIPGGGRQDLVVELGNQLPDEGMLRVRVRASRSESAGEAFPSLQLWFGWQASNEGRALLRVSDEDQPVTALPESPQIIEWQIPLGEIYPRNSVRKTSPMGATPSPSEYIRIRNSAASGQAVQIDYVQIEAPHYEQWPPSSHRRIFASETPVDNEEIRTRELLGRFMKRAWRRPVTSEELERKVTLFQRMRADSDSFEQAVEEVIATVLSSPKFLFVGSKSLVSTPVQPSESEETRSQDSSSAYDMASRLALFLWCSVPDEELLAVAASGGLDDPNQLAAQVDRMLDDPRSQRFSEHFVSQWLNLELLGFVNFQQQDRSFDPLLKQAMQREPIAFFEEVLGENASVLDFLHADYAVLNERLARHYGIGGVQGNHFRRVALDGQFNRGGLLTQAGMLAMNSDWPDSHPLKRAIWLLECLLADPPPPPPPAVPQIDLANPEIAKMTLKERMEDHRNQAACRSCHARIDPWGIAFENYDALGRWRDTVRGKPVDASSELFNQQTIDGMEGLKRFLLRERQDQFVRAMVEKLATYAMGRPLGFEDSAEIDAITAKVRKQGDGLKAMIVAVVSSDLFQAK